MHYSLMVESLEPKANYFSHILYNQMVQCKVSNPHTNLEHVVQLVKQASDDSAFASDLSHIFIFKFCTLLHIDFTIFCQGAANLVRYLGRGKTGVLQQINDMLLLQGQLVLPFH